MKTVAEPSSDIIQYDESKVVRRTTHKNQVMRDTIVEALKCSVEARSNDFVLCLEVWRRSGQITMSNNGKQTIITIKNNHLHNITKPETISRCRRDLRNDEKVNYNELTSSNRKAYEQDNKKRFANKPVNGVQNVK